MYTPKYFKSYELVDKTTYEKYKNSERYIFYSFNPLVLITADMLREKYGPATINDYYWGGRFSQRGLRADSSSTGATMSAHKRGAALDMVFKNVTAEKIRQDMRDLGCMKPGFKNKESYTDDEKPFQYINRVESTENGKIISWFHFDIFNSFNADGSIMELHV